MPVVSEPAAERAATSGELLFLSAVSPYEDAPGRRRPAGVHQSLGAAATAFAQVASMCGLGYRAYTGPEGLSVKRLSEATVLALYTIGETPWSGAQRQVIERRVASGDLGLVGVHSATDSAYRWPAFGELMGARFDGHPVTGRLSLRPRVPAHPAIAHLPCPWSVHEELYLFSAFSPKAQVLLDVELPAATSGEPNALPMCWCIEDGCARTFYTVVGHFLETYEDPKYIQHLLGAVEWVTATRQVRTVR